MEEKRRQDLHLFAVLWPLASQLHLLSLGEQGSSWMGMLLWGLGALCMMLPGRGWLLALLGGAQCVEVFVRLPWVANHWLFVSWVNVVLLVGLWRSGRGADRGSGWTLGFDDWSAWMDRVRGPVVVGMAVLYGMALFHKLNAGFWDPQASCAVALWESIPQVPELDLEGDHGIRRALVVGTLSFEALVPVLLLWTRWRWLGILIGAGFHVGLGFVPYETYYNFSSLMLALYVLILPRPASRWLHARWETVRERCGVWGRGLWMAGVGVVSVYLAWDSLDFVEGLYWTDLGVEFFRVLGPLLWLLLAASLWAPKRRIDERVERLWKGWWVIIAALGVNALGPYIGWKSELSFSMYSNLQVRDGQSNHWLIPRTLDLWGWQSDWVQIRSASSERLRSIKRNGQDMTWFEFRDHLARDCDEGARFTRKGKRYRRNPGDVSPPFSTPLPWWTRKLVRFRPIDRGPVQSCVH